ncbi:protein ECERIFERUM 16 isoform X2 [Malania oleifera]|uniref:protein ECERIFERUM 16 isoform X2 n=1 Tax=Malania oleifera TaxID=397392 RepID=UPI0025ADE4B5|nr:protein ECERIFERUM 16 isoform X2 [Malania oleifera]
MFYLGVHSMLSIRGQSILSWIEDDNFIVDDRATSSHEAPFLSLNLHTLADQLAKVDLSQRLFIEADLLPSELQTEAFEASSSRASEPMPSTHASEAAARISDDSAINDSSKKDQIADQNSEIMPFGNLSSSSPVPTLSTQWSKSVNQTKDDSRQFSDSDQSRGLESTEQPKNSYLADPKKNPPVFEPSAAEAELDLLLNSFGETSFLDSSSSKEKPSNTLPVSQETPAPPPQIAREGPNLYGTASATANLDNAIDDLLEETCNLMNQKDALLSLDASAPLDGGALSHSNPKSKVLDDFDSWLDTIG